MKRTSISLPPELEEEIKKLAAEHHRSMHGELIYLLESCVKQEREQKMRVHEISVHKENMSVMSDLASKGLEPDYEAKSNIGAIYTFINDQERIPVDKRVSAYQIRRDGKVIHSSWPEKEQ